MQQVRLAAGQFFEFEELQDSLSRWSRRQKSGEAAEELEKW